MDKIANIEVEIRAIVPNFIGLRKQLVTTGAEFCGESYLRDVYFCPKDINTLEEVEMNEVGSYSLRLREEQDENGNKRIELNTKTITNHGDHNAWEEHEVTLADPEEMANILTNVGFKPFFKLEKTRYRYRHADLNIFLDEIKDFDACIEIEKIVSPGNEMQAKIDIINFLNAMGIPEEQFVPKSVTNMVMKARAFK